MRYRIRYEKDPNAVTIEVLDVLVTETETPPISTTRELELFLDGLEVGASEEYEEEEEEETYGVGIKLEESDEEEGNDNWTNERLAITSLVEDLLEIQGVKEVELEFEALLVVKNEGVSWDALIPSILNALLTNCDPDGELEEAGSPTHYVEDIENLLGQIRKRES